MTDNTLHVMPVNDLKEHTPNTDCWCNPTQDTEELELYIHHALDGREAYENGKRKPN